MEHLPHPVNPVFKHAVGYYHRKQDPLFDNGDWATFPQRVGWEESDLSERPGEPPHSVQQAANFIQQWMYFGLLQSFFHLVGIQIDLSEILTREPRYKPQRDTAAHILNALYSISKSEDAHILENTIVEPGSYTDEEQPLWVTTNALQEKLVIWETSINNMQESDRSNCLQACSSNFQRVKSTLDVISHRRTVASQGDGELVQLSLWRICAILPDALEISIRILVETLEHCCYPFSSYHRTISRTGWDEIFFKYLHEMGWCRGKLRRLELESPTWLYVTGLLGPPKIKKSHKACTRFDCNADQIDESTYEVTHEKDCVIPRISPSNTVSEAFCGPLVEKVNEIVNDGGLPLIAIPTLKNSHQVSELSSNQLGPYQSVPDQVLSVVKYCEGMRYVAISHVWSDGLGNPASNTILTCRLFALIEKLDWLRTVNSKQSTSTKTSEPQNVLGEGASYDDENWHYVWLDVLCVPLSPRECRRMAIQSMQRVFRSAGSVLVLDNELMMTAVDHTPLSELLLRFVLSRWQTRLWTLLEGVLAEQLFIQFKDGAVHLGCLFENVIQNFYRKESPSTQAKWKKLLGDLTGLFSLQREKGNENGLADAIQLMRTRTTSRSADEGVCLSFLLDLDVQPVLQASNDDKWKTTLRELAKAFNPAFLFDNGPKMQEIGWRWAPSSLLNSRTDAQCQIFKRRSISDKTGITDAGIIEALPGIIFEVPEKVLLPGFTFTFHGDNSLWIAILALPPKLSLEKWDAFWKENQPKGPWRAGLIGESPSILTRTENVGIEPDRAALVKVMPAQQGENNLIHCEYVIPATITCVSSPFQRSTDNDLRTQIIPLLQESRPLMANAFKYYSWDEYACHLTGGALSSAQQLWCIS